MLSRRFFLVFLGALSATAIAVGCQQDVAPPVSRWIVGLVSYDDNPNLIEQYQPFKEYLGEATQKIIELEPALNELQALERIKDQSWAVVFAPPGLAAIAISKYQYTPLFSLEGINNVRSVLVVRDDSELDELADLSFKVIALGQPGSATGYYLPLYDLYGLTLQEARFASTPQQTLQWLDEGSVDVGALSENEFQTFRRDFSGSSFRVLHTSRKIPLGAVLVAPTVDLNEQERIKTAMANAIPTVVEDAGYVPNAPVSDFSQFIKFVEKVRPLEKNVKKQPVILEIYGDPADTSDASESTD